MKLKRPRFKNRKEAVQKLHSLMDEVHKRTEGIDPAVIDQEVAEAIQSVREKKNSS